jgi:hypothetical protein
MGVGSLFGTPVRWVRYQFCTEAVLFLTLLPSTRAASENNFMLALCSAFLDKKLTEYDFPLGWHGPA